MKIIIFKENETIFFKLDDEKKEFTYENLDILIDKCLNKEVEVISNDEELNPYKDLISKILEEIKKDDFLEAIK